VTDFLDLDELAVLLGIDRVAVYALVRSTELPAIKTASGWYVDREQALRYKDSR
jgi:excisionase family DNA binding protein